MRNVLILLLLIFTVTLKSQHKEFLKELDCNIYYGEAYGEFERNTFDIVMPNSNTPTALVVYIHGGGFLRGDKAVAYHRKDDIKYFVENNIAFATLNYRFFKSNDSLGIKVSLGDVKRAIQFIRYNSGKYNIDKSRVGCYGGSAGAGSSLYLAFHDDMAIEGDTTLLGESTRIQCAGAIQTQATYNVFRWKKFIPWMGMIEFFKKKTLYNTVANFYGYPEYKSFKPFKKEIIKSLDMLDMIDSDDPPVYLMNLTEGNFPSNYYIIQHHRKHAMEVSRIMNKNNVENVLYVVGEEVKKENDADYLVKEFLVDHLKYIQ